MKRLTVAVTMLLALAAACGSSGERTQTDGSDSSHATDSSAISLATVDSNGWPQAIVTGTLVVDPPCVYLDASERGLALFPAGAKLERRNSDEFIAFPDGRTIGPAGAEVRVVGGETPRATAEGPGRSGVLDECLTDTVYWAAPLSSAAGTSVPPDSGTSDDVVESPPIDPGDTTEVPDLQPTIVEPHPDAINQNQSAIDRVTVRDDGTLEVAFWNGVEPCYELARVDVTQTDTTVTITLWTGSRPEAQAMVCIELAQSFATLVSLDAPLGDRTLIDGSTGQPAPLGG
jgi:hypothetical protein